MGSSIADVAAAAGVSIATVSRALRGLPNVAPSTRSKVLRAAEELRYVADPNASRLAAGRTQTIGMVVPVLSAWSFGQVISGAEAVLAAAGYDVLLYSVSGTASRERFFRELPFRKRVDALIVVDLPMSEDELDLLAGQPAPIVAIGVASARVPCVAINNVSAAFSATDHLLELGHTRIGLICGPAEEPLGFSVPDERRAGYRQALRDRGLAADPALDVEGNFSMAGGAEAMAQLLEVAPAPTAVFAQSDEMAFGALHCLSRAGLDVPGDVSVVGFDDHDLALFAGLTTVRQPVSGLGEVAATLALQTLNELAEGQDLRLVLDTSLVIRTSTGPVRVRQQA